jgi:hypothetical protein
MKLKRNTFFSRAVAVILAGTVMLALASRPAFAAPQETQKISQAEFSKAMRKLYGKTTLPGHGCTL